MRYSVKLFLPAITGLLMAFMPGDRSGNDYNVMPCANSLCAGDIDFDGFNDIVIGSNFHGLSILKNDETGSFTFSDSIYFYAYQDFIQIANLDTIPNPEIIFTKVGVTTEYIGILFNNDYSDSVFLNSSVYPVKNVVIGDVDANGFNDVVYCSDQGHRWGVFYNDGYRHFTLEVHSALNNSPYNIACGDLNNDGRADVVTCGQNIVAYYSTDSGFQKQVIDSVFVATDVKISDFDNDGLQDILVIYGNIFFNSTTLFMYRNNGDGTFERLQDKLYPGVVSFFIADFNNDNLPDILFQRGDCMGDNIYYNQGNFQLADSQFVYIPNYGETQRNTYCSDMDGNACIDIITIRSICDILPANVNILYNDGKGHFLPDPMVDIPKYNNISNITFSTYPNPFHDRTEFNVELPFPASAELSVYDPKGQFIDCLVRQQLNAGPHRFVWNPDYRWIIPQYFIARLSINGKVQKSIRVLTY